eukprot:scaffold264158_cov33-Prasinocladus_malaysianus.AAC.7
MQRSCKKRHAIYCAGISLQTRRVLGRMETGGVPGPMNALMKRRPPGIGHHRRKQGPLGVQEG